MFVGIKKKKERVCSPLYKGAIIVDFSFSCQITVCIAYNNNNSHNYVLHVEKIIEVFL